MKKSWIFLSVWLLASASLLTARADDERALRQSELDAACEAARQKKLAVDRARYVMECVEKKQRPDRAACERFYADYGERAGNRPALYYDLPECVAAHDHRSSYRRSND